MRSSNCLAILVVCVCVFVWSANVDAQLILGTPEPLSQEVNQGSDNWQQSISTDDLSLYFASNRSGNWDVLVGTRESTDSDWTNVQSLGNVVNTSALDGAPDISTDELTLFFNSDRPNGEGDRDIWMTARTATTEPWQPPTNLGPVINSGSYEAWPTISGDGLSLYYSTSRNTDNEMVVSHRSSTEQPWSEPESLGLGAGSVDDITLDGLTMFFSSDGAMGGIDIFMTTRATTNDSFGEPMPLPAPVNTSGDDFGGDLSADGKMFYYYSGGSIWQAPVVPEPGSLLLGTLGMVGLLMLRRRTR